VLVKMTACGDGHTHKAPLCMQREGAARAFEEVSKERADYERACERTKQELDGRIDFVEQQRGKKKQALQQRKHLEENLSRVHEEESAVRAERDTLQKGLEETLKVRRCL
jgi:hypothetical protein